MEKKSYTISELIKERIATRGIKNHRWIHEYRSKRNGNSDEAFIADLKEIGFLPTPCGERHETVYNEFGVNCNSICINFFKKDDCLPFGDDYATCRIYSVIGLDSSFNDEEEVRIAESHKGEIYVLFLKMINRGNGAVELNDTNGIELSLEELEEKHPDFLKDLMFNLK